MRALSSLLAGLLAAAVWPLHAYGQAARPWPPARSAGSYAPAEPAGRLTALQGRVFLEHEGERRRIRQGPQELSAGDRISVEGGRAMIVLIDGSRIELLDHSSFQLEAAEPQNVQVALSVGRLRAVVSKMKRRLFQVRTQTAVAAVRGTEFWVAAEGPGRSGIAVVDGMVAVRDNLGSELLLRRNERVEVYAERMGRAERFDPRREPFEGRSERKEERRKERRDDDEGSDGRRGDLRREGGNDRLKTALEREIGFQRGRDAIETAAAFEMKNALYQEGKTLIDAFGQRVRVEEYITRPDPATFKFVSLNFRDNRLDYGLLEVTANKALPKDLRAAGNLWFSPTAAQPEYFAVRQRWSQSNSIDRVDRVSVDGQSVPMDFLAEAQVSCTGTGNCTALGPSRIVFHQTVFGNQYEFINGSPAVLDRIWAGALRPADAPGMMWHAQPIEVKVRDALSPGTVLATYWANAFLVTDAGNGTGKTFVDRFSMPAFPSAQFRHMREYINFVDGNGNGIMDFPEAVVSGCPVGDCGLNVFHDLNRRLDGTNLVAVAGAGVRTGVGDSTFFSDRNGTGAPAGNPSVAGIAAPNDLNLLAFARLARRDWLQADHFVIDDLGKIQNLASPDLQAGGAAGSDATAKAFERLNFERTLTSSRFPGRKIDIVMNPRLHMQAGLLKTETNKDAAPNTGGTN